MLAPMIGGNFCNEQNTRFKEIFHHQIKERAITYTINIEETIGKLNKVTQKVKTIKPGLLR